MVTATAKRRIKLKPQHFFLERGVDIPGYVWREPSFVFSPEPFALTDERLQPKIFDESYQINSLARYEDDPTAPALYAVASEPNDAKAMYFAAYLVQLMLESVSDNRNVKWERVFGDFKNETLYSGANLSMLVLSNLTPNSTAVKLEKTRDLLEMYSSIPRVVVISGEDPITFCSRKLYCKVNNIFFHSSKLIKRRTEVVGLLLGLQVLAELFSTHIKPVLG